ncbi:hypothetical protein GXW83_27240 [Streptacidiphilus sp. PB12-B1b]|uniref:hypothetical protein n=1 Tax=Streptacidiphilus sp. PB12-B1b TaxID=2705012 RepID=UPI0015FB22D1|nr:hypothetical protein [Streptacidiphilus sp. PB12-B1b]QMU78846.1 hypothetical protein GXW83_27240 [Streptacidiphilus sp. PB12-B1b]
MFAYLRLARGYRALDLGRWLLTAAASAAVAALLLRALGRALSAPDGAAAHGWTTAARLLWCLPPLVGVGYLAAAWARSVPLQQSARLTGLLAAGAGAVRLRALLALEIALACALGTVLGLLGFLALRAHLLELVPGGRLEPALGGGTALPAAATATLLAVVPLLGGLAAAAAVRPRDLLPADEADLAQRRPSPRYLGAVLLVPAVGLAVAAVGVRSGSGPAEVVGGLIMVAGIGLAVPALLYGVGTALAWGRPRPARLLAGRGMQAGAWQLGTPLAVLTVTGALAVVAADRLAPVRGPLPGVEAGLVALCVLGALLARVAELTGARRRAYAPLYRMGAPTALLRGSALLRAAATTLVLLAAGGGAAALAAALATGA